MKKIPPAVRKAIDYNRLTFDDLFSKSTKELRKLPLVGPAVLGWVFENKPITKTEQDIFDLVKEYHKNWAFSGAGDDDSELKHKIRKILSK